MRQAELLLYDVIGEDFWTGGGITGKSFAEQLTALDLRAGDELTIRVNSPGGSVFDGWAIYNTLLQHPARKVVKVEGLAASAASYVIQAADRIEVAEASFLMIHRAWGMGIGNAEDFVALAAELEKFDGVIAAIYALRSKRPVDEFLALMSEETWFTGAEAIEAKLADALIEPAVAEEPAAAAASVSPRILSLYRHVPAALTKRLRPAAGLAPVLPIAACMRPEPVRDEGKVLSGANQERLTRAQDLIQEVLDSAGSSEDSASNDHTARRRAELLDLMNIELALVESGA